MRSDNTLRRCLGLLSLAALAAGCRTTTTISSSAGSGLTPTNLVVAADGSGQFRTVQDAIMAVPNGTPAKPVIIHIKPGVYKELIYVQREKRFFHLVGEDSGNTVLTFDLSANLPGLDGKKIGTFHTPSTQIDADDFTAENITFENSSGTNGQALAIRVDGDRAVFQNCQFLGWQDTVFLNRGRQYFTNCYIEGHVDFIFGGATAFFDHCHIHAKADGYLTAASTPDNQPFGFVFDHCKITGADGAQTYLGRPWRIWAKTAFLNTDMDDVVRPEGWYDWKKPEAHTTTSYAEFNSSGAGANPSARVGWAKQLTPSEAGDYTVKNVLHGDDHWNPLAD
jgi:pectinesterase